MLCTQSNQNHVTHLQCGRQKISSGYNVHEKICRDLLQLKVKNSCRKYNYFISDTCTYRILPRLCPHLKSGQSFGALLTTFVLTYDGNIIIHHIMNLHIRLEKNLGRHFIASSQEQSN